MGLFRRRQPSDLKVPAQEKDDSSNGTEQTKDRPRGLRRLWSKKKRQPANTPQSAASEPALVDTDDDERVDESSPPTTAKTAFKSFEPSAIQSKITEASVETSSTKRLRNKKSSYNPLTVPPPAREAAFHGPPRFDWIDIEYAAATKIQSIHRRNMVMTDLERKGMSTSAIRNRKRRRKATNRSYYSRVQQHDEAPGIFNCCALGLVFGDLTEDDDAAYREYQRRQYEERVQQQQEHEDAIRKKYLEEHGMKEAGQLLETLEVPP